MNCPEADLNGELYFMTIACKRERINIENVRHCSLVFYCTLAILNQGSLCSLNKLMTTCPQHVSPSLCQLIIITSVIVLPSSHNTVWLPYERTHVQLKPLTQEKTDTSEHFTLISRLIYITPTLVLINLLA